MAKKNNPNAVAISRSDLRANATENKMLSILPQGFVDTAEYVKPEGAIVKVMSPLMRPKDFPVGKVLVGKFAKLFDTNPGENEDGTKKIGEGLEIIPPGSDIGIALPAVATLKTALEITRAPGQPAVSPYVGRIISVQKMENRIPSKKGNDAWHFIVAIHPESAKK